ncbi:MAG: efflux RND transporter periplasmic adaptor subunit [Thiotrichales bacterium]|nr:efflux RND transporter periplasmic adaptor subunit [Thiotrichales bacterium]
MLKIKHTFWILSLFGVGLLSGCQPTETPPEPVVLKVQTLTLGSSQSQSQWQLIGTLQAKTVVNLALRVGGEVQQVYTDLGQTVQAGQKLVELDMTDRQLEVRRLQAQMQTITVQITQVKADLQRIRTLEQRKLASEQARQQLETQLKSLEAELSANQQQLAQAQNQLRYGQLKAPFTGVIQHKQVEVQQIVSAGQTLFELVANGEREVKVAIPENRIQALPKQAQAEVAGTVYSVSLRTIEPAADPASRTWTAFYQFAALPELDAMLLGQSVKVRFEQVNPGWQLPLSALYEQGDYPSVWVVEQQRVKRVAVQVLRVDERSAWVTADLAEQSKIVVLGVHLLNEGQRVEEMTP